MHALINTLPFTLLRGDDAEGRAPIALIVEAVSRLRGAADEGLAGRDVAAGLHTSHLCAIAACAFELVRFRYHSPS